MHYELHFEIMELYLIIFCRELAKAEQTRSRHKLLIKALEKRFDVHLVRCEDADSIPSGAYKMAFIATGYVEDKVLRHFSVFPYPITLLTDGLYGSLGAAMEVAASIRSKDLKVRVIHGTPEDMAEEVMLCGKAFAARKALRGKRIGVIGTPAPWLVASHVDYYLASQRWGVNYVDIPIDELARNFHNVSDDDIGMKASEIATRAAECRDTTPECLLRAMRLYEASRRICLEHKLDAITLPNISVADILDTTGDLALSLLNDEGIPAGCEGDLQSIATLMMVKELTGQTGFMGDTTFVDTKANEVTLAHCAIATKLTEQFTLCDHFEAHKGVALRGIVHEGPVTVVKFGGECLDEYFVSEGWLTENTQIEAAPRTQLKIKLDKPVSYFLQNPLGSHHIVVMGHHAKLIQHFMQQNRSRLRE